MEFKNGLAKGTLVPLGAVLVFSMLLASSTVTEDVAAATGILETFTNGETFATYNYTRDAELSDMSLRLPKESNILEATMTLDGLAYYKSDVERSLSSSSDWRAGITSMEGGFATMVWDQSGFHLDMEQLAPFKPESTKSAGTNARGVATGDYNDDGRTDVVVTNYNDNTVTVFTQNAAGTLVKSSTLSTNSNPIDVETGDLNDDGQDDFAVACYGGYSIDIFISKSTGGFENRKSLSTSTTVQDIAVGDLNSDTLDDIVIATKTYYGQIWQQRSDGNFTKVFDSIVSSGGYYSYTSYRTQGVAIGDFNGDGRNDIVWTLAYNYPYNYDYERYGFIRIHLQSSSGGISTGYSSTRLAWTYPIYVSTGDLNGDGRDDVVTSHYYTSKARVFFAGSGGSFPAGQVITGISNPGTPTVADFDGDGNKDLVLGGYGKKFGFAKQDDGDLPTSFKTWTSSNTIYGSAAGDVNGDGAIDAITANGAGDAIGIWMQKRTYSGAWVSSPPITQPLLIRYVNFTLDVFRNGGDTRVYFSKDGVSNWTEIESGINYDLVNRTRSFYVRLTSNATSAAKFDRILAIGMKMTYETYPSNLMVDLGADKNVEWQTSGELIGTQVLGTNELARALTEYVQNVTHPGDAEGFVNIPVAIYSSTPGRLDMSALRILFNNASVPPKVLQPADNGYANATPTFRFFSNDTDGDLLIYKLQITKGDDFSDGFNTMTFDMSRSLYDEKEGEGFPAATFQQGEVARFTLPEEFKLVDNTRYRWRVLAFDGYLWSRPSKVHTIVADTISPIGFSSSPKHSTVLEFTVTWFAEDAKPGSGLMKTGTYDLQYRKSTETMWNDWLMGTTQTSQNFTGEEGTLYYFRMRARDAVGNEQLFIGGKGDTQTFVDTKVPTVTWGDMQGFQISRSFLLRWVGSDYTPGSGIKWYEVHVRKEQGDWSVLLLEQRSSQWVYTADADTTFTFRVRAFDNAGNVGPWSEDFSVRIDATSPILVRAPRIPLVEGVWEHLDYLEVNFSYVDPESGLDVVEIGLGSDKLMFDVMTPTEFPYPANDRLVIPDADFINSEHYYLGMRARNKAGALSEWVWSDEFTVAIPGPVSTIDYPTGTVVDPAVNITISITDPRDYNITLGDLRMRYATYATGKWTWSDWERVSNARADTEFEGKRGFRYQFMFRAQNELGSWGQFWTPREDHWFFVNNPPIANGGPSKVSTVGKDVQFSADESKDPDGDSISYKWDFGDGETATGLYASHRYDKAGLYTIRLTVSDGFDESTSISTIYVEEEETVPAYGALATLLGLLGAAAAVGISRPRRR